MSDLSPKINEKLARSATFSHSLSCHLCEGSHIDQMECSWYHGAWQYLRLLDMVSAPIWHEEFYREGLWQATKDKEEVRILISGTADYTMLAMVDQILDEVSTNITVLDACQSALVLCEWYGIETGVEISTEKTNILSIDEPAPSYDIIIADAFLTRFDRPSKDEVVDTWYHLLNTEGAIITTIRIESDVERKVESKSEEVSEFGQQAFQNAKNHSSRLPVPPELIRNLAIEYAENIVSYPISSINEAHDIFRSAGFTTVSPQKHTVKGEMKETLYCQMYSEK